MSDDDCKERKVRQSGEQGCVVTPDSTCVLAQRTIDSSTLDTIFEVLSSRRYRQILYHLVTMDGEVIERAEVADVVEPNETDSAAAPSKEDVLRDLHHRVLPRLQDLGFIEYDTRHGTVRYDAPPAVEEWVTIARYKEQRDGH